MVAEVIVEHVRDAVIEPDEQVTGGRARVREHHAPRRAVLPAPARTVVAAELVAQDLDLSRRKERDLVGLAELLVRVGVVQTVVALVAVIADERFVRVAARDGGDVRDRRVSRRIDERLNVQPVGGGELDEGRGPRAHHVERVGGDRPDVLRVVGARVDDLAREAVRAAPGREVGRRPRTGRIAHREVAARRPGVARAGRIRHSRIDDAVRFGQVLSGNRTARRVARRARARATAGDREQNQADRTEPRAHDRASDRDTSQTGGQAHTRPTRRQKNGSSSSVELRRRACRRARPATALRSRARRRPAVARPNG